LRDDADIDRVAAAQLGALQGGILPTKGRRDTKLLEALESMLDYIG
jgi:hypothetical protein